MNPALPFYPSAPEATATTARTPSSAPPFIYSLAPPPSLPIQPPRLPLFAATHQPLAPRRILHPAPPLPFPRRAMADLGRVAGPEEIWRRRPKTKIVCTLGPASRSVEMCARLLRAGMCVARFNFSHGSHEYHQETLDNLHKAMEITGILCAVMLDTKVRSLCMPLHPALVFRCDWVAIHHRNYLTRSNFCAHIFL